MKRFDSHSRFLRWSTALALSATLVACGGGREPILGADRLAALVPTVVAVAPLDGAGGVPTTNPLISATFNQPMAPFSGGASFTVTCSAPCVSPTGTVALDATKKIATFTLPAGATLAPLTVFTATVTGARSLAAGLPLDSPFVWHFTTTGVPLDTTRPTVTLTAPATTVPGPTAGVPTNADIMAVFSEEMTAASLVSPATAFTLSCATCVNPSPAGTVSYTVGSKTAIFAPAAALEASKTYTATITAGATDLAGNGLAGDPALPATAANYVWKFTTATAAVAVPPSVLSTNPVTAAVAVCPDASINATFTVGSGLRMDPSTLNAGTFGVKATVAGTPVTAASVVLDTATGRTATFVPSTALTPGVGYTATIKGGATGVKDLAIPANPMLADYSWNFTVGPASGNCLAPVALGAAKTFGTFGGSAGMTNMGLLSVIHGDIGTTAVSTAVTGFHDAGPGCTYTETPLKAGLVTGLIYTAAPPPTVACPTEGTGTTFAMAQAARADALTAYNALVAMPTGANPGANLAGKTLAPGVYTSPSGSFMIEGGDLTLDAQGNANAVWVFRMATTLTVGGPGAAAPQSVILSGGAQAKNVYWQVGSAGTINAAGGGTMVGTIISQEGVSFSTAGNVAIVTLNGRAISLGASVTMVNTVINVPAP